MIRFTIALEIMYNYLCETDPKVLLDKLYSVYALKLLAKILCLRWGVQTEAKKGYKVAKPHQNLTS